MKLFGRNLSDDIAVIAEVGVNHEGNVDAACHLVELAAKAGADAVKLQSYTPERFVSAVNGERLQRVTRFGLDRAAHDRLIAVAKAAGIQLFSTPVTEDWIPYLATFAGAMKVASGDLVFEPTIRATCRTGKPVIISTGMGELDEIDRTVAWAREEVGEDKLADRIVLMQCVSAYPTPIESANTRSIPFLRKRYGVEVGFSNHCIGPNACFAAAGLGARVFEVHFTDVREGKVFRDHQLSFEPDELRDLTSSLRKIASFI